MLGVILILHDFKVFGQNTSALAYNLPMETTLGKTYPPYLVWFSRDSTTIGHDFPMLLSFVYVMYKLEIWQSKYHKKMGDA